jgi:hypothetical protein
MAKPGHEQPELDYRSAPESSLLSSTPDELQDAVGKSPEAAASVEIKPVAEIMADHESRQAEKAARWEELTNANWPPGRIEERLDAEFPDLRTSEEIEAREVARIKAHASQLHKPKRDKTRVLQRSLGPNQRNIADGDKRVEAEYGKPDSAG